MPNRVFVLDTNKKPLTPCRPVRARQMLSEGRAAVYRRFPFTIILKEALSEAEPSPVTLKVDPGSKTTGIVLVQDGKVIFAAELEHRGQQIKDALEKRRAIRRSRRNRKTRYRKPKFQYCAEKTSDRPAGWLAPSLKSRVDNLQTWFMRFFKLCDLTQISMELVRFDTQLMQDAEVSVVEYQQGEAQGYEIQQSVSSVSVLQREEGQSDRYRVWVSEHPITSQETTQGCQRGQLCSLGDVWHVQVNRLARRSGNWRSHQVQSHKARLSQSPLDRCSLRRQVGTDYRVG